MALHRQDCGHCSGAHPHCYLRGCCKTINTRHCGGIFGSEVAIDVIKHAILGKLNDMRPGMYREFMRDTCEQVYGFPSVTSHSLILAHGQFVAQPSSGCHTVVGVLPFSAAAVVLRLLWRGPQGSGSWMHWAAGCVDGVGCCAQA